MTQTGNMHWETVYTSLAEIAYLKVKRKLQWNLDLTNPVTDLALTNDILHPSDSKILQ